MSAQEGYTYSSSTQNSSTKNSGTHNNSTQNSSTFSSSSVGLSKGQFINRTQQGVLTGPNREHIAIRSSPQGSYGAQVAHLLPLRTHSRCILPSPAGRGEQHSWARPVVGEEHHRGPGGDPTHRCTERYTCVWIFIRWSWSSNQTMYC